MVNLKQLEQVRQSTSSYYKSLLGSQRQSLPRAVFCTDTFYHRKNSAPKSISEAEIKVSAAHKHKVAERKRRLRINGQYATLRAILPNLVKTDKASVLGETIKSVTELKKRVEEFRAGCRELPSEADRLSITHCDGDGGLVKATLNCRDRPGIIAELTKALKSVKGRVVKAEIMTVGGRTRIVMWVQGFSGTEEIGTLRRVLNVVLETDLKRKVGLQRSNLSWSVKGRSIVS